MKKNIELSTPILNNIRELKRELLPDATSELDLDEQGTYINSGKSVRELRLNLSRMK